MNHLSNSSAHWLASAASDLKAARLCQDDSGIFPEVVCFHAQQSAEKAIKAVLLNLNIDFPLTHDIQDLIEIAEINNVKLSPEVRAAEKLTPFAVETRYPHNREEITEEEVKENVMIAEHTLSWAEDLIRGEQDGNG